MEPIAIAVLLAGFYVAWSLGANGTGDCIGTAVGGRILSYRRAVAILILFVLLGAGLEGWKNMHTIGEGIVTGPLGTNPFSNAPLIIISALLATGIWTTITTMWGLPISSSQSMVGAIIGAGLLLTYHGSGSTTVNIQFGTLGVIFISWLLNPIFAILLAFAIYKILSRLLRRVKNIVLLNQVSFILIIATSAATAYALGANDVGASTGAIYAFFKDGTNQTLMMLIGLFGGIGLAVGALTYSQKVMRTMGSGITKLDALSASAAQLGAALTVWSFVQFKIPVSTTQAIVGAVAGVGLVKGATAVSGRKLGHIWIAWVMGPIITCVISILLGWLILTL
jgi:PiT family inorganic phosphate transporter